MTGSFLVGTYLVRPRVIKAVQEAPAPSYTPQNLDGEKVFQLVNEWRLSEKKPVYIVDNRLCEIAKTRVKEIQTDFSHTKFRLRYDGSEFLLSENLSRNGTSENWVLYGWLNSPPHREILDMPYKYSCVAADGTYVVQIFSNFEQ